MYTPSNDSPPAVALVTGASRGLGRGIAEALARDGLSVAVHYASNRAAAEETAGRLPAGWPRSPARRSSPWAATSASPPIAPRIVAETLAGLRPHRRPGEQRRHRPARARRHHRGHRGELRRGHRRQPQGPLLPVAAVVRHWLERRKGESRLPGGYKLIFVSSISAYLASINRGEYCISKAGLAMATKLWATRLATDGRAGLRGAPGHHGHRHDRGREGEIRQAHRRGPGAAEALGHRRGRGPGGQRPAGRAPSRFPPATSSTSTAASTCRGCRRAARSTTR